MTPGQFSARVGIRDRCDGLRRSEMREPIASATPNTGLAACFQIDLYKAAVTAMPTTAANMAMLVVHPSALKPLPMTNCSMTL